MKPSPGTSGPASRIARLADVDGHLRRLAGDGPRPAILLAIIVVLMTFPLIAIRSYHFEEGLTVAMAKGVLAGTGPWYEPELFGARWAERPVLLSWIVALISLPFGEVHQAIARLPVVASLYAGALLVFTLVRSHSTAPAALFGALCFLFSPAVFGKAITAESDVILTVTQFAAFVLWWAGYREGGGSLPRWIAVGLVLGATALYKGPQPAAFFALGVGAFILIRRSWRELPGYLLAGVISLGMVAAWYVAVAKPGDETVWMSYGRLGRLPDLAEYVRTRVKTVFAVLAGFLPGVLLAVPAALSRRSLDERKRRGDAGEGADALFTALVLYAGLATLIVIGWPASLSRYAMPAIPAVAAMAGLAYEPFLKRAGGYVRLAGGLLGLFVIYQFAWNLVVAPAVPDRFATTRLQANLIETLVKTRPAPVYAQVRADDSFADMILAYLTVPVLNQSAPEIAKALAPAWLVVPRGTAAALNRARDDARAEVRARFRNDQIEFVELVPK